MDLSSRREVVEEDVERKNVSSPNIASSQGFPVAIVGIAFRFPGDISDEGDFWRALKDGKDLVTSVPSDRWATDELQHDKRSEPGKSITFSAGVLSRIDEFDAGFFGISPREAAWLDPQQRLLLELSWEALENADIVPSSIAGSDCAVYVGISSLDYGTRGLDDLASLTSHMMTGNTLSVAANRLSYVFDLRGPSLAVDTACSSSLVALHHACTSLHTGQAGTALVGGVNLLLHPYPFVGFTKASMLSADGRSKAFDASGDGYVRSEGGCVLLLKPLDKALADGNEIHAVIRASGVNADGARKTGITIPSRDGQAELMRAVLARSGLAAHDIDFVEAHGTGTVVGDPIEASAIGMVYGQGRPHPLPIGSVKANLGHLESASGMAGLVKAVLALKHRALPPALHLKTPNPRIDFSGLNLELVTQYKEIAKGGKKPLVAGLNSFGFGGANAHVILQEHRSQVSAGGNVSGALPLSPLPPLFLSARTETALRAMAGRYVAFLSDGKISTQTVYDVAYASAHHREWMEKRLAIHAESPGGLIQVLADYAQGKSPAQITIEDALPQTGSVAFVYAGNGAQWIGMGRRLFSEAKRFKEIITQIDKVMKPLCNFSVVDELFADEKAARLDDTVVAQPLLFAVQVGITTLLRERGVAPAAVIGHSVGEVAAAWAAGALSLDQAIRVIVARSAAQGTTRGTGRMAAVALSDADMRAAMLELGPLDVVIAGINSPNNVTLSGSLADLERIEAHLKQRDVFFRLLDLDYAFHSSQMDPVKGMLAASLRDLTPLPASNGGTLFISTVTGDVLDGAELGADYWWRNVREPVRFADAVAKLADAGCRVFVEIGPHAILQRYIGECLTAADVKGRVLPTLRKNDDGQARMAEAALAVHMLVGKPDLQSYFPQAGRRVRLPNYPWQRERHWHPTTNEGALSIGRRRVHPLLGWRLHEADEAWENTIDPVTLPWLGDHQVGGAIVFPGAAYAEMALAASREWLGGEQSAIEELDIIAPMVFDDESARTVRFILNPRDGSFHIKSRQRLDADDWMLHAAGRVLEATERLPQARIEWKSESGRNVGHEAHYRLTASLGLDYGSAFRGFGQARIIDDRMEVSLALPEAVASNDAYSIHPAALDICYQSLVDFFADDIEAGQGIAFLPIKAGRLNFYRHAVPASFRAHLRHRSGRSVLADFELFDASGELIARVDACRFRAAPLAHRDSATLSTWRVVPWLRPHPMEAGAEAPPAVQDLVERLHAAFAGIEAQRQSWFKGTLPLLEALVLAFAYEAFQALAKIDLERASPYKRWLAGLLHQEKYLIKQNGQWQLAERGDLPTAEEIWQTLLRDSPACLPQLLLLGRVGRHLPQSLNGSLDGPEFLRALTASSATETLYDDDPAYFGTRFASENTLRHLASIWPKHRRLRVLEISAGLSELPRSLLDVLPGDRLDYVLALADEEACQRQQVEYQEFPNVILARLNPMDWTLETEQILPEAFDVVILRHTLSQAGSPPAALAKVRRLLAGGGVLLLAERHPDWGANMLAGLDPAWWHEGVGEHAKAGELNLAPLSSFAFPKAWQQALGDAGFEDIEHFAEPAADGLAEGAYLLFARRPAHDVARAAAPASETWLLWTDAVSSRMADRLRIRLEAQGQQVVVAEPREKEGLPDVQHVVHLAGWNAEVGDAANILANLLRETPILSSHAGRSPNLWIVTRGGALVSGLPEQRTANPVQAGIWGSGRVIMNEYPALNCRMIDLACDTELPETLNRLERELLYPDGADEIVLADAGRYALLMQERDDREDRHKASGPNSDANGVDAPRFRLDFPTPGQLRNLLWRPEVARPLLDGEIEVRTQAAGLNFRDVMYLMGLLPDEAVEKGFAGASLGLEFSGVVTRTGASVLDLQPGDAVMGFGASCFSSHVITRANAVAPMPEAWTFEAAATVPTVFFTVYYALKHLADLQPGERVLIHGGAGGVGIAAIQLARHLGAEVFATAGSDEKRDFVRLLGADHVFDSRSLAFVDDIHAVTGGEGVDVVLNSLAGEAIRRNLSVLKPFGRFLELGKRDFFENTSIGLRPFKDNISYFGIDADQLLIARPKLAAQLFREVMDLFDEGALSPLPYRVFSASKIVDAFRVMQQARHIGKVVVSLTDARPRITQPAAKPQTVRFEKNATWLVTGGLAGFGLESARWLAEHGVGNLVLLGRRGIDTPGAEAALAQLAEQGVNAVALPCDITDEKALKSMIGHIQATMPPLKGILHAAMVLDDRVIANLDLQSIDAVVRPKLVGAWNLHQATLNIPLDHFVLYSSITTAIGNPGQANYVAANAALEGLAEMRCGMGLPATCIGWGPIGDAGYLTRNTAVRDSLGQRLGKPPSTASEALAKLGEVCAEGSVTLTVANFDWSVLSRLLASAATSRFSDLNRNIGDSSSAGDGVDFRTFIADRSAEEIADLVHKLVVQEVAQILCIGEDRIDPGRSLHDLGLDSLMAVELALGLEQRFGIQLPVMMLNESPTTAKVTLKIVGKLAGDEEAPAGNQTGALVERFMQQHGEDVSQADIDGMTEDARTLSEKGMRLIA